jgi:hypothetical protein
MSSKVNYKILDLIGAEKFEEYPIHYRVGWSSGDLEVTDFNNLTKTQKLAYNLLIKTAAKTKEEAQLLYFIFKGEDRECTNTTLVTAAYDTLLKLEGHREIENRVNGRSLEVYGLNQSAYTDYIRNSDATQLAKAEYFRRMRIFAHNYTDWAHPDHLTYWFLHCDEGYTLEEIAENHYIDLKTRQLKKVSKCWLSMMFKPYKKQMEMFFVDNPGLLFESDLDDDEDTVIEEVE